MIQPTSVTVGTRVLSYNGKIEGAVTRIAVRPSTPEDPYCQKYEIETRHWYGTRRRWIDWSDIRVIK